MTRATIEDVARRAGVTKSTVSHALSGKRPVSPETRRRIDDAIAALGYRPNPVAQRLAAGRSGAIGFVYPLTARGGGPESSVLAAASEAVGEAGFAFVLFARAAADPGEVQPFLESGLLDGVVVGQVQLHDERVWALREAGVPFVMMGRTADNSGLSFVDVDVDAALEECVEHLVSQGHRQLAFLHAGPQAGADASRALQAYERACVRRRLKIDAVNCPAGPAGGRAAAVSLLQLQRGVTGLIATGDLAAWAVRQVAAGLGRRTPEDLSLVCLGTTSVSEALGFEPTGVGLRYEDQARAAVTMLLGLLGDAAPGDTQVLLDPVWIDGTTAGPAPAQT